jgi:type II secretory pathway pseudopilin PulG
MKLLETLAVIVVVTILASIALPVAIKVFERAKWRIIAAKSRNDARIEMALLDEPRQWEQARFEFLLSSVPTWK